MAFVREDAVEIARRFVKARHTASGLSDYPGELPKELEAAYAIQDAAIAELGRPILGWKVGRIAPEHATYHGVDRLAGPVFEVTHPKEGEPPGMPVYADGFAAAEAEFLLRIGKAPSSAKSSFTLDETAELTDAVHVGIEIASSPLETINALGPAAIVSDFGNNNGLLIGPAIPNWNDRSFEQWEVITWIDGREVGRGSAASFAHGALGSARFLFELLARRAIQATPGQWISSGAVTGVHRIAPGMTVDARFDRWYELRCTAVAACRRSA